MTDALRIGVLGVGNILAAADPQVRLWEARSSIGWTEQVSFESPPGETHVPGYSG